MTNFVVNFYVIYGKGRAVTIYWGGGGYNVKYKIFRVIF